MANDGTNTSNPIDSSDSETEFSGFDITDTRDIFTKATKTSLFTSTPKPKPTTSTVYYSESDESDEEKLSDEMPTNTNESDSGSDISGEIVGSIFSKPKKIKTDVSPCQLTSSSSESDIEGELACATVMIVPDPENESRNSGASFNCVDDKPDQQPKKRGRNNSTRFMHVNHSDY